MWELGVKIRNQMKVWGFGNVKSMTCRVHAKPEEDTGKFQEYRLCPKSLVPAFICSSHSREPAWNCWGRSWMPWLYSRIYWIPALFSDSLPQSCPEKQHSAVINLPQITLMQWRLVLTVSARCLWMKAPQSQSSEGIDGWCYLQRGWVWFMSVGPRSQAPSSQGKVVLCE
jgi:hypothetical protein